MVPELSFQLTLLFNQQVDDPAGNWQYAGADAVEATTGRTAKLIATKRDNSHGGANFPSYTFPASMLTATVMFAASGTQVPPNLTLQGIHDLTTNDETGSVSAASPDLAAYIGGAFAFDAEKGILTICPRPE
jgi:hypothetical protein